MEFPAGKMNQSHNPPSPTRPPSTQPNSVLVKKFDLVRTKLSKLFQSSIFLIFCLLLIPLSKYLSSFTNAINSIEQSTEDHTFQISGYPLLFGPTLPNEIIKPTYDHKEYKYITLKNGIKVLMISDLTAEQSSAALVLEVGSTFEPYEIPGLAHLLEHILSIGSKNHDKNSYESKVFASAAISREEAAFYYDRSSGDFEESLDLFVDPFINPRFDFEWYNPELYRIDEEYKEKIEVKVKRFFMAFRRLVDPESRFSRDYTGNLETLLHNPIREGINVTRLLKEFFQAYYSSNLMSLVVLHNKPLNEMEKMIENSFSKIPNKEFDKPSLDGFPLPLSSWNKHKILKYYTPATPAQEFEGVILFQICGINSKSDAIEFILDVLKSDIEGSLAPELKLLDWIFKMRTYFFTLNSDCGMLRLMFDLTIEGNNKFEGIVQTVFGYVKKFIEDGLTEELYNQHFYHRQYSFKYLQTSHDEESDRLRDQMKALAKNMLRFPKHRVLSKFEPFYNVQQRLAEAKHILEQMNTENLMLMKSVRPGFKGSQYSYINKSVPLKDPEILENYDPMANLYYSLETVSRRSIKKWNRTKAENFTEFRFYKKNPYYPKNFSLVNYRKLDDEISKSLSKTNIVQIKKDQGVRIWYSPERNVEIPVVAIYVKSRMMRSFEDQILYKLMLDFLSPGTLDLYSPEVEGIRNASHSIEITPKFIKIEAFSDTLPKIIDWVSKNYVHKAFDRLTGYNPSPHALLMFDYKFSMKYSSTSEEEAMRLVDEILVNRKCTSGVEIKENVLKKVVRFLDDPNEFFEKKKEVLSDVEYLFYGNILPDDALRMAQKIGFTESGVERVRNLNVFNVRGNNIVYRANMLNLRKNESLVMNYYQGSEANSKNIAKLKILLNIMNRMILGLNIEKELNIKMKVHEHIKGNTTGFIVYLQNKNFKHAGIDLFIEDFLEDFVRIMHRASEDMIENEVKEASKLCARILESQPQTFGNKVQEIFSHIDNEDYTFTMKQDVLHALKGISGKEYLEYMDDFFANCGKLSLQGFHRSLDFSDQGVLEADSQWTVKKQPHLIKTFTDII